MPYKVIIPKAVQKQLDRLPAFMQVKVVLAIQSLTDVPRPSGVVNLKGYENQYRIRIGTYRVRYEVVDKQQTVNVLRCRHRSDVYRD